MSKAAVNADLVRERKNCTFNTVELTHLLDGGAEKTEDRKSRESFFLNDHELKSPTPLEYLSHKEKYEECVRKACVVFKKVKELQERGEAGVTNFREILGGQLGSAILSEGNPFALHYVMFIPTILGQGTIEQQAEWIQRAWNCDIIGTYAQTELGHGTFIRGLETTATYDPTTEEFVLKSPTLTSYKWWPGGLGQSTNYAVVVAQLISKGVCHGIHPFIVQLRDENTHNPLPGIKIGEIGCKLGMNGANNGFLGFENVRIPRTNMLMKNSQVLPDGTYVKSPSSKLTYGTMIFVRVVLVQDAAHYLRKAVTIAVRYSAVRHQSQIRPDQPEPQILDFVTQQHKLFPLIATYFAIQFAATWLWNVYNNVTSELDAGSMDSLPELHAAACCLKAVSTADATQGVQLCRFACGGHGYMTSSNLPNIYGLVSAQCTYEGENTVLLLQTARFLIKSLRQSPQNMAQFKTVSYLHAQSFVCNQQPFRCSADWLVSALQYTAAERIRLANRHISDRLNEGLVYEDAWNSTSIELVAAAEAHCHAFIAAVYMETIQEVTGTVSPELTKVLVQLQDLYVIYIAIRFIGDLLRFTKLRNENVDVLQHNYEKLLAAIRVNAVGIVDGFDIHDEVLASTLGAYDGNVYKRLFDAANLSPLNRESVNASFQQYMKPFFKSKL